MYLVHFIAYKVSLSKIYQKSLKDFKYFLPYGTANTEVGRVSGVSWDPRNPQITVEVGRKTKSSS